MHSRLAKLLVATAIVFGLVGSARSPLDSAAFAETPASSEPADGGYRAARENGDFRVTLLGVTKGISFLKTPEPVGDGGRANGNHPVRWMRVAALVEALGEKNPGPTLQAETADGAELVDQIPVELNDRVVTMRAMGIAEMDLNLNYGPFAATIFPVALPNMEANQDAKVFVYTLSGDMRPSDTATLRFQFGMTDDQQEVVFEGVPLP
ncbi:MAG TPA: hypothetical protein VGN57_02580 [Pirellulaceae bacterium]|jgi:hypothetical protein|nr:hypothetical protein [Pirellulaceae bacterium]